MGSPFLCCVYSQSLALSAAVGKQREKREKDKSLSGGKLKLAKQRRRISFSLRKTLSQCGAAISPAGGERCF